MLNWGSLYFSHLSKILGYLENLLASNFSSKCVWGPFECLSDGFVPLTLVLICVLAGITVTTARDTVEPWRKTLAVKLKTATVATITTSESFRRCLQASSNMFWRLRYNFMLIVFFACKIAVRNKRNKLVLTVLNGVLIAGSLRNSIKQSWSLSVVLWAAKVLTYREEMMRLIVWWHRATGNKLEGRCRGNQTMIRRF